MKEPNSILLPAPPFILGAGLLLWGWQNQFLAYAAVMAIIVESARLVHWRWSTLEKEFNNIADLSGVAFFIAVVYIFFTVRSQGIYTILSVLPFVFFLVLITQLYSEQGTMKLSVLLVSLRKLDPESTRTINKNIDITLPYFMLCLISASAGNQRTIWFYILVCLLLGYILWRGRPVRYHATIWVICVTIAVAAGYAGQIGIRSAQRAIELSLMSMFDQFMWRYRDPNRATTAIGSIGRLKFSDRILLRVKTPEPLTRPLYLHEATYNSYNYGVWSTSNPDNTTIDPDSGGASWTLNDLPRSRAASIATYMVKDTGVIPLPHGASKIKGTGIIEINQNHFGTINMEIREGWIRYTGEYNDERLPDWQPVTADLHVNDTYKPVLERLARELSLYNRSEAEILRKVKNHFQNNFLYSLSVRQRYPGRDYLSDFLFVSRQGHCEFFATSTVLLLRSLGIPARYAVGYYIDEYSTLEGQYIGRSRDAHAWVLAYVNKQWQVLDTTPATWAPFEDDNASSLQSLFDLAAWLRYKFSRWQTKDELDDEEKSEFELLWLLIPLTLILAWRLYIKERIQTVRRKPGAGKLLVEPGMDSEFYRLVNHIEGLGHKRRSGETLHAWLSRCDYRFANVRIEQALRLHYQYRFDPAGLTDQAKNRLAKL
ncbi:MAG: transglutaminase-like enzyme, predicted cysteine protease, partial [Gammaproteobacteria bacterium]|nr:transglutaminase-like enzyme, predicted cysteine protease [Gammaproteobacteria bacterium]